LSYLCKPTLPFTCFPRNPYTVVIAEEPAPFPKQPVESESFT
jgi:hypothetical protein